ncbi:MAG: hypothetical protein K2Z81_03305, partial [Cyanobacteria bacterium]|nr:hypothetical protein [Cyanobacteriota bacterium]
MKKATRIATYKWCRFCGGLVRMAARWCMHCGRRTDDSALPTIPGGLPEGYQAVNGAFSWLGKDFGLLVDELQPSLLKTKMLEKIESITSFGMLQSLAQSPASSSFKPSAGAVDLIRKVLLQRTEDGLSWPEAIEPWRLEALDITLVSTGEEIRLRSFELDSDFVCQYCAEYRMEHASVCRFCRSDFTSPPALSVFELGHDNDDLRELLLCVAAFRHNQERSTDDVAEALVDIGISREEV